MVADICMGPDRNAVVKRFPGIGHLMFHDYDYGLRQFDGWPISGESTWISHIRNSLSES
jgi:hypothetical protein